MQIKLVYVTPWLFITNKKDPNRSEHKPRKYLPEAEKARKVAKWMLFDFLNI